MLLGSSLAFSGRSLGMALGSCFRCVFHVEKNRGWICRGSATGILEFIIAFGCFSCVKWGVGLPKVLNVSAFALFPLKSGEVLHPVLMS